MKKGGFIENLFCVVNQILYKKTYTLTILLGSFSVSFDGSLRTVKHAILRYCRKQNCVLIINTYDIGWTTYRKLVNAKNQKMRAANTGMKMLKPGTILCIFILLCDVSVRAHVDALHKI